MGGVLASHQNYSYFVSFIPIFHSSLQYPHHLISSSLPPYTFLPQQPSSSPPSHATSHFSVPRPSPPPYHYPFVPPPHPHPHSSFSAYRSDCPSAHTSRTLSPRYIAASSCGSDTAPDPGCAWWRACSARSAGVASRCRCCMLRGGCSTFSLSSFVVVFKTSGWFEFGCWFEVRRCRDVLARRRCWSSCGGRMRCSGD
jgi:hypothetical protein